jgi:hypothetical protein
MEENKIHNRTQAARQFGVSYHTFITWLHCRPEMDARVQALGGPASSHRGSYRALVGYRGVYRERPVDVAIPVRRNILHLATKQDEHLAELNRLLTELRQGS